MSKAATRKDTADILNQQRKDRKMFFAARRQEVSGIGNSQFGNVTVNNPGGFSIEGGNFNVELGFTNPLQGGNFLGPIAFNTVEKTISSGKLTMATILETPTSYVLVNGESAAADDLVYIISKNSGLVDLGAIYSGQLLFLQAGDANITLKHNTGNIFIPSGSDLTLNKYDSSANTGGAYAILMWDDQNIGASSGRWVLVSSGSGSSSGMQNPATSNLNMATYDITSICRLEFDLTGTDTLANGTTGIDATSSKMHFNVPTGDTFSFTVNNTEQLSIASNLTTSKNTLDMNAEGIQNTAHIYLNASGTNDALIDGNSGGIDYKVPTGDEHTFQINNSDRMTITSTDVEIQNWIDIRNPTTTQPTNTAFSGVVGWVKIEVDGNDYRFPVWNAP